MSRNHDIRRSMLEELLEGQPAPKKHKAGPAAPVSTLMFNGQRAYGDKRYEDAVVFFSQVIESLRDCKTDLLPIYEQRSEAFIGQQKLDLALKDAKQMIKLDRADCRGYLKCSRVEQLRGQSTTAIQICELGLKSVPCSDTSYAKLETCLLRIKESKTKQIIYDKGTDPMVVLPVELLALLIASFEYREIVATMRVSKSWYSRLSNTDIITQSIDTRTARRALSYEQIKAAFLRLGRSPKHLALARLNENAARYASTELGHWIRWESLRSLMVEDRKIELKRTRFDKLLNLQQFSVSTGVSLGRSISEVLIACPSLRDVVLGGMYQDTTSEIGYVLDDKSHAQLRNLTIGGPRSRNISLKFPDGRSIFPNLEKLSLHNIDVDGALDLSSYTDLTDLALWDTHVNSRYKPRTPIGLQRFTLKGLFANMLADICLHPEEINMPSANLSSISVTGFDSIRFLSYCIRQGLDQSTLRHLTLAHFVTYTYVAGRAVESDLRSLNSLPGKEAFRNVNSLTLADDDITNGDASVVAELFPEVEHLDLEASRITEEFVTELIRRPQSKIRTVNLRNCAKVSENVLRWGKARNVDVKFTRRSNTYGAKARWDMHG